VVVPVVRAQDLCVTVGGTAVLDRVDLSVADAEIVAVTGDNGAGKSTLLRCLVGLQRPSSGSVTVCDDRPDGGSRFWRMVAFAAEEPAWYPGLTVREHLDLVRLTHASSAGMCMTVGEALIFVGLDGRGDAAPAELSTGQRQRLAIAAVLVRPRRLLLLDEPEHGLDAGFRRRLADLIRDFPAMGTAVVMATHDRELLSRTRARAVHLVDGRLHPESGEDAG
jgi:ABC-type multidrug transport system ATPase subunit